MTHNNGMQNAGLAMTGASGGTALFKTAAPLVASISSAYETPGSIVLGNTTGPVNTILSVGDASSVTTFWGPISQASGTTAGLTKTGGSTLYLSGENTYTGVTTVLGEILEFDKLLSLYHGNTASWTAAKIVVASGATLGFKVNSGDGVDASNGEFLDLTLNTNLPLGGFAPGSFLGIDSPDSNVTLSRDLTQPGLGLVKTGAETSILNLTGANTSTGIVKIFSGAVNAASATGTAINGNVLMGNGSAHVFLNFGGSNQIVPTAVISFAQGNFYQSKINLRGTNQTIAGLDSPAEPANRVSLIQNDESTATRIRRRSGACHCDD